MNKPLMFTTVGIVLLIVAAGSFVLLSPKNDENTQTTVVPSQVKAKQLEPTTAEGQAEAEVATRNGVYADYSETAVASATGTKLLFFHAPWCPQCRELEASIKADGVPTGVTVFKVDYDSNQALRQKYGVTQQTTFVKIDDSGAKLQSYVAYEEPQFTSVERELLK